MNGTLLIYHYVFILASVALLIVNLAFSKSPCFSYTDASANQRPLSFPVQILGSTVFTASTYVRIIFEMFFSFSPASLLLPDIKKNVKKRSITEEEYYAQWKKSNLRAIFFE